MVLNQNILNFTENVAEKHDSFGIGWGEKKLSGFNKMKNISHHFIHNIHFSRIYFDKYPIKYQITSISTAAVSSLICSN